MEIDINNYFFFGKRSKLSLKYQKYFKINNINYSFLNEKKLPLNKNIIIFNFIGSSKLSKVLNSNYDYPKYIIEELLKRNNKIQWIQFSSMSVYKINYDNLLYINEDSDESPDNDYGNSKLFFDKFLKKVSLNKNFSYLIFRIPSIDYYRNIKIKLIYFILSFLFKFNKTTLINYISYKKLIKLNLYILFNCKINKTYLISNFKFIERNKYLKFYDKLKFDVNKIDRDTKSRYLKIVISYLCYRNVFTSKYSKITELLNAND